MSEVRTKCRAKQSSESRTYTSFLEYEKDSFDNRGRRTSRQMWIIRFLCDRLKGSRSVIDLPIQERHFQHRFDPWSVRHFSPADFLRL